MCLCAKLLWSCLTLSNPVHCSLPGSSVHGILQARILEWVAWPSSREIFLTQGWNPLRLCLLHWKEGSLKVELFSGWSSHYSSPVGLTGISMFILPPLPAGAAPAPSLNRPWAQQRQPSSNGRWRGYLL